MRTTRRRPWLAVAGAVMTVALAACTQGANGPTGPTTPSGHTSTPALARPTEAQVAQIRAVPGLGNLTRSRLHIQQSYGLKIVGGATSTVSVIDVGDAHYSDPLQIANFAQLSEEVVGSLPRISMYVGILKQKVTFGVKDLCCTHYVLATSNQTLIAAVAKHLFGRTAGAQYGVTYVNQAKGYSVSLIPVLDGPDGNQYQLTGGEATELCQATERSTISDKTTQGAGKLPAAGGTVLVFIGQEGMCNTFGYSVADARVSRLTYNGYSQHMSGLVFASPGNPHAFTFTQSDYSALG